MLQADANAEFGAKIAALEEEKQELLERMKTVEKLLEQTRKQQVGDGSAPFRRRSCQSTSQRPRSCGWCQGGRQSSQRE
jgi:hypothetical protein